MTLTRVTNTNLINTSFDQTLSSDIAGDPSEEESGAVEAASWIKDPRLVVTKLKGKEPMKSVEKKMDRGR